MLIEIPVPIRRQMIKQAGRAWLKLCTQTTVTGREHIPTQGPYIAIGNHVAALEVALMVAYLPHVVELVGNGDVPLDPLFGGITRWYSFIAIKRGSVDRTALRKMCAVLERGGVLGVFPEGGIWEHDGGAARPGVAWISQQTGAPILPIGFGGMIGALDKAIHFKRPHLTMNIGPLMPPVAHPTAIKERHEAIETASAEMMQRIRALIPNSNGTQPKPLAEQYTFRVEITAPDGSPVPQPDHLPIPNGAEVASYFHHNVLLEVIYRNWRIEEARPLSQYPTLTDPVQLGAALAVALDFYRREAAFLGYRLGYAQAGKVIEGLTALRSVLAWAAEHGYQTRLLPERTVTLADGQIETSIAPSITRHF